MDEKAPQEMNAQEEKELKRVFDHLAGFSERKKLKSQMKPKRERKALIENFKKNFEATRVLDVEGKVMTPEQVWVILINMVIAAAWHKGSMNIG